MQNHAPTNLRVAALGSFPDIRERLQPLADIQQLAVPHSLALVPFAVNTPASFWKTFFKVLLGILLKVS